MPYTNPQHVLAKKIWNKNINTITIVQEIYQLHKDEPFAPSMKIIILNKIYVKFVHIRIIWTKLINPLIKPC
jgi:hypothetical protein